MITISELYIYPVKSLGGMKLSTSKLSPFGLKHDRRWMVVDENGKFLSQREIPKMATITTTIVEGQLELKCNNDRIIVPAVDSQAQQLQVSVWKDTLMASKVSEKVDLWLSQILGQECQLVYMHDQVARQIDTDFAPIKHYVSFADAYPILVISQESLNDLNKRLDKPVNINRFRANIIVDGCGAFSEDDWQGLSINGVGYLAVKKCSRCIMPSINQETGNKDNIKMLSVLNTYRKENKKIKFGQNLRYKNPDIVDDQSISCGDEIKLLN